VVVGSMEGWDLGWEAGVKVERPAVRCHLEGLELGEVVMGVFGGGRPDCDGL
jgi:hypothetical protein